MEEVSQLEDVLTSSDRDLIAPKAALVMQISKLDVLTPEVARFESDLEAYTAEVTDLDDSPMTPAD